MYTCKLCTAKFSAIKSLVNSMPYCVTVIKVVWLFIA